ncbi:septal ring lytic transglycosylase RlpA family protein [Aquabacter cavernae]|uniref:septal ring lytic transglycosylase RlpA family protein n=1 Tax=Aquabacter cavernae TaxID=2496029 RepID=UPI000F8EFB36|nr:septal ring lytic transglycosylase RlpA family protein [Aquabacter cavernae]
MVVGTRIALATLALTFTGAAYPALADTGQTGTASYYWQGRGTASGERFNANAMTAAHRSLPFNTKVKVTNLGNGRSVVVRINDRGPFIRSRIIDVSRGAANELGFTGRGLTQVKLTVLGTDAPVTTETATVEPAKATDAKVTEAKGTETKTAEAAKGRTRVASLAQATPDSPAGSASATNNGWTVVPSPGAQAPTQDQQTQPTP